MILAAFLEITDLAVYLSSERRVNGKKTCSVVSDAGI